MTPEQVRKLKLTIMPQVRGVIRKRLLKQSPQLLRQLDGKMVDTVANKRNRNLARLRAQHRMQSRTFFPSRNVLQGYRSEHRNESKVSKLATAVIEVFTDFVPPVQHYLDKYVRLKDALRRAMLSNPTSLPVSHERNLFLSQLDRFIADVKQISQKKQVHRDRFMDLASTQKYADEMIDTYGLMDQVGDICSAAYGLQDAGLQDLEQEVNLESVVFSQPRKGRYPEAFGPQGIRGLAGSQDVQKRFQRMWMRDKGLTQRALLSRARDVLKLNGIARGQEQVSQLRRRAGKLIGDKK